MATDLALVTVLIQLLLDMVTSDNIDFYNLMPALEGECVKKNLDLMVYFY